jgi:hypothetical protein
VAAMDTADEHWVETEGFGRCRLDGNAHTFPGRIDAWSETLDCSVTISRSDIREASPTTWAWIDGFLAGNEPEFHEFLGIGRHEAGRFDDDDPAYDRYRRAMADFRRSGSMPTELRGRPTLGPPSGLPIEPWSLAGGQAFGWDGSVWVVLDPQPDDVSSRTICAVRGHHELEGAGEVHLFCVHCGMLIELEDAPTSGT